MAGAVFGTIGKALLPMLAEQGMKVLGDMGSSLVGKLFGGKGEVNKIGRRTASGIGNFMKQSVKSYMTPGLMDKSRKPGGMPNSLDYPTEVRATKGRRRARNTIGFDNVANRDDSDDEMEAAARPQKRFRSERDFFDEDNNY